MISAVLILIAVGVIVSGLVFATKKGWVSWKGGHGIASLTVFHDFQTRDKQEAIEIVIREDAGEKMKEQESGQGNDKTVPQ